MKSAISCYAACFLALLACKGINFGESRDSSGTKAASDSARDDADDTEETVASEPVSVGGAFLGCFLDPQIEPDLMKDFNETPDSVSVGCQAFDNADFTRVLGRGKLVLDGVDIQTSRGSQPLAFKAVDNHPRWSWLLRVPAATWQRKLYFNIRASEESSPIRLFVELLDILPAAVAAEPLGLTGGSYKLRVKGSTQCLAGNAAWAYDPIARKPITESLQLVECANGFNFQFLSFQNGFRFFVSHPEPPTCNTETTPAEVCGQSCVDLENYGLGPRFVLWICTRSVEAQSFSLVPGAKGAVRLQANGRFILVNDNLLLPDLTTAAEFELIPHRAGD